MDCLEVAGGWLHGYDPDTVPVAAAGEPSQVLEPILLRYLGRSPCFVAFSGGRDSSVLLAAAVRVARREGLPLPVPITLRYPEAPDTDECHWQDIVLRHLGVRERIVLTVHDEHDPIGPIAGPLLRRHGLLWPPNLAPTWRMLDQAHGGALLTGEGGDETFGLKRVTPLTKALRARGRVNARVCSDALRALTPAPVRRSAAARLSYRRLWLRAPVEALLARRDADDVAAYSLHAGRHTRQFATRRCARHAYETVRALGAEIDTAYVQAFAEPEFVASVASAAGFWGWTGRTATMRALFDDLLPRTLFERSTKATFGRALFTEQTRAFARGWTGDGVDEALVDPEALRDNWLSARPYAPTMSLLQQAWLAHRS